MLLNILNATAKCIWNEGVILVGFNTLNKVRCTQKGKHISEDVERLK
jgi:hypothetical protein